MAVSKRFDSFKLEDRASTDEDIEKVELVEALEPQLNRNLEFGPWKSPAQLPLINLLVEESSELAVNVEDASHHVIRDFAKDRLIQTTGRCAYLNWHKEVPQNRKIRNPRLQRSFFFFLFSSPTFSSSGF